MQKSLGKWFFRGLIALIALLLVAAVVFVVMMRSLFSDLGAWFSGSNGPERVELLAAVAPGDEGIASGRYALILGDFVTGAGPRLISDPAELERLAPDLWYLRESHAGTFISSAIGLTLGANPYREIGALLHDGATLKSFNCLSVLCRTWPDHGAGRENWGMGDLRDAPAPGQPVERLTSHFENYDAYLIAHKSIAADPTRWFALPGGEVPDPPATGMRIVYIDLPSELVALSEPDRDPSATLPASPAPASPADPEAEAEMEKLLRDAANTWIGNSGGRLLSVEISTPRNFDAQKDGQYLYSDTGILALPGIGWRDRSISLEVPEDRLDEVTARMDFSIVAPPDMLEVADAAHRSFEAWGYDASCLPACGGVDTSRISTAGSFTIGPRPSWTIESWRLMPDFSAPGTAE